MQVPASVLHASSAVQMSACINWQSESALSCAWHAGETEPTRPAQICLAVFDRDHERVRAHLLGCLLANLCCRNRRLRCSMPRACRRRCTRRDTRRSRTTPSNSLFGSWLVSFVAASIRGLCSTTMRDGPVLTLLNLPARPASNVNFDQWQVPDRSRRRHGQPVPPGAQLAKVAQLAQLPFEQSQL